MNKHELNTAIRKLGRDYKKNQKTVSDTTNKEIWHKFGEENTRQVKEFKRLYRADDTFEYMNRNSILIMIRLNLSMRAIELHRFGMGIEL